MTSSISQFAVTTAPRYAAALPRVAPQLEVAGTQAQAAAPVAKQTEVPAHQAVQAMQAGGKAPTPDSLKNRSEISFDEAANRFVARLIDRDGGEVLVQYPSKEELRLLTKTREQLEHLLDVKA